MADAADFLALFDRILPGSWLQPLKENPDRGYELLQAAAAMGAQASGAVAALESGTLLTQARGGARASVNVELYRPVPAVGPAPALTVKAGSVVTTSRGDRRFVVQLDVAFGSADLGPHTVLVRAVGNGGEWNVPGRRTTAAGEILQGEIDTVYSLITDPLYADPTIAVRQIDDASGGRSAYLDGLARDRGMQRQAGEGDPALSLRSRSLPDTVSPDAIQRQVAAVLARFTGMKWWFIETFEREVAGCYNAPSTNASGQQPVFVLNDPRPQAPLWDRLLDFNLQRAAFILVVPRLPPLTDSGMVFNDPAISATQLRNTITGGSRAVSAYSLPSSTDPSILQGVLNGTDDAKRGVYATLWRLANTIKAGGVAVALELEGA